MQMGDATPLTEPEDVGFYQKALIQTQLVFFHGLPREMLLFCSDSMLPEF